MNMIFIFKSVGQATARSAASPLPAPLPDPTPPTPSRPTGDETAASESVAKSRDSLLQSHSAIVRHRPACLPTE